MTELEQLIREVLDVELTANEYWGDYLNKHETKIKKTLSILEQKYFVTLKEHDSSADNNKVEQSINQEKMMSQIEDMAVKFADAFHTENSWENSYPFQTFREELKQLFQTHRNTVSTAVKQKDDNLVDEDELRSKIAILSNKLINYSLTENIHITNKISLVESVEKELIELFKTYQNSNCRPVKD